MKLNYPLKIGLLFIVFLEHRADEWDILILCSEKDVSSKRSLRLSKNFNMETSISSYFVDSNDLGKREKLSISWEKCVLLLSMSHGSRVQAETFQ